MAVASADEPSGSGRTRSQFVEFLDGPTGCSRWSIEWALDKDEFAGHTLRVFSMPDADDDGRPDVLASWSQELGDDRWQLFVRGVSVR
jgi:hypothetical protein